jgi:chemosensory pili system protein ChpA (sensor histidine kinase/response regulator)
MVGLDEFGEAGWAMEQMLNAWLAEQRPMPQAMQQLAQDALKAFAVWAQDIENQQAQNWSATAFRAAADAMRLQGERAEVALVPRRGERAQRLESAEAAAAADARAGAACSARADRRAAGHWSHRPCPAAEPAFAMPELDFPWRSCAACAGAGG